ncbi:MAG: AI-2E family transporter [Oscillospiraceae bacterium]|nr:AI-2E family transporter [Oscillospiraceae bacterium]
MKFDFNKRYTTIAIYALAILFLTIVFAQMVLNIGVLLGWIGAAVRFSRPFVFGLAFAFLLNPLMRVFDDRVFPRVFAGKLKRGPSRAFSILLTYIIALTLVTLFIALAIPQIIASILSLADNISVYITALEGLYARLMGYIRSLEQESSVEVMLGTVLARILDSIDSMLDQTGDQATLLIGRALAATQYITSAVLNIFLGLIASIYLLASRERLLAQLNKLSRAVFPVRQYTLLKDIAKDSTRILSGFVIGRTIESFIVGVLCFIGMTILRLPYAVLISAIVGITNVIPFFGPFIGAIPSFLIIYVQSPTQAIWFAIFILVLQQFDGNYMMPKIVGDSIGMPPVWVLFSILFFGGMWGVLGMFIGVPLFAIIYSIVKRIIAFILTKKGESTQTKDYASEKNPLNK